MSFAAVRALLLRLHRWVGLGIATFLVVAGTTGAALVYHEPLDAALYPAVEASGPPLDPVALIEAVQREAPHLAVDTIPLIVPGDHAVAIWVSGEPDYDQIFVDPTTGRVIGARRWGDLSEGRVNLMPFLLELHYSLALGEVGSLLFGVAALLWTLDCFVGLALTFPIAAPDVRTWLSRWRKAWWIRGSAAYTLVFAAHRAVGLWIWILLLAVAWSAVGMNLHQVQVPVVRHTLGFAAHWSELPKLDAPRPPTRTFRDALTLTRAELKRQAAAHGFTIVQEERLRYDDGSGLWQLRAFTTLDVNDKYPGTAVWVDDRDGHLVQFHAPTGQAAGNTLTAWVDAVHFAALGPVFRVAMVGVALAVAGLSASGAWMWWRRWRGRRLRREESAS